ncbi:TetR/AcrR family transcriptional regulator [Actinomadura napierensis]|uniref:HTH tetR-type domain-containing protein n=1 Tax=Actinomadura napierensis TaxID=267854 RepID=A0ABN2YKN9_9ACTN
MTNRGTRQQADDGILDKAAALFARHGYTQTSVQAVADSVGLSKAGLLHHFPSKEALRTAVVARIQSLEQEVLDQVAEIPLGPARDRVVLETLYDQAIARPGLVALAIGYFASLDAAASEADRELLNSRVLAAFGDTSSTERVLRITGAVGALSLLVLTVHQAGKNSAWRGHVIATSMGALGH